MRAVLRYNAQKHTTTLFVDDSIYIPKSLILDNSISKSEDDPNKYDGTEYTE